MARWATRGWGAALPHQVDERQGGTAGSANGVVLEPQRVLRSYLGKAFVDAHDNAAASGELRLAKGPIKRSDSVALLGAQTGAEPHLRRCAT
jgi:hypothetical protein